MEEQPKQDPASAMLAVLVRAFALLFSGPLARAFQLVPLSPTLMLSLLAIVAAYLVATDALNHWFYRHFMGRGRRRR